MIRIIYVILAGGSLAALLGMSALGWYPFNSPNETLREANTRGLRSTYVYYSSDGYGDSYTGK